MKDLKFKKIEWNFPYFHFVAYEPMTKEEYYVYFDINFFDVVAFVGSVIILILFFV